MKKQVLLFILMLMPLVASAYDVSIDGIYYNLDTSNKVAEVTYGRRDGVDYSHTHIGWYSGSVVIPNTITHEGVTYSVTSIDGLAFTWCTNLTSLTIGKYITSIAAGWEFCDNLTKITFHCQQIKGWFADMESIREVIIGDDVTIIEDAAFNNCYLTSVTIGKSVTSIGSDAFRGCYGQVSVIINDIAAWCKIDFGNYYSNPLFYHGNVKRLYLNEEEIKDLVVPEGVTSISSRAFEECSGLLSVTIPNSVTSIGEEAFTGCSSLTSLSIGNNVTSIGNSAFSGCSSLTSLSIGNGVTSIGSNAFTGCNGIEKVTFNCRQIEGWFAGMNSINEVVIGDEVTSIASSAFQGCSSLASVKINDIGAWCKINFGNISSNPLSIAKHLILNGEELVDLVVPDGVTSIGSYAFYNGSSLTSVTIPNGVTSIGSNAFTGCNGIEKVTFNCRQIEGWFAGMNSINEVVIGDEVTSIASSAFQGCSSLASVKINDIGAWCKINFGNISSNPLSIAKHLILNGKELVDLVVPDGVTSIGSYAFYNGSSLTSVTIPNGVTSIGSNAFTGCNGIEKVTFNCRQIEGWFAGMNSINEVVIGDEVTSIASSAFQGCSSLASVKINDIGAWCKINFGNISSNPLSIAKHLILNGEELVDLVVPDGVTNIGSYAFYSGSSLTSVTIPNSVTSIGSFAFYDCSNLTSVTIPNSVTNIGSSAFDCCSRLTSVTIPNSVTSIGDGVFAYCSNLTSVTIPNSVTNIGNGTFYFCSSLTSVTIPNSIISIGGSAFSGCSSLASVTIPNSVTSIGYGAFSDCSSLTSVTIPNSVTSIDDSAFSGCSSLTSVTIPNSVKSIGSLTFYYCSDLSSVSIGSGIESIGSKAFAQCPEIHEVYCYAENVPAISSDTFEDSYYIKYATLYVPESSVELYKASAWSQFGNIVGITGGTVGDKCEKPTITLLANGKIKVECATEGATCFTNITASNAEPLTDGEISLNTPLIVYTVTAYATREGYADSDVATATFRWEKAEGDVNGDGTVNISDVTQLINMILSQ